MFERSPPHRAGLRGAGGQREERRPRPRRGRRSSPRPWAAAGSSPWRVAQSRAGAALGRPGRAGRTQVGRGPPWLLSLSPAGSCVASEDGRRGRAVLRRWGLRPAVGREEGGAGCPARGWVLGPARRFPRRGGAARAEAGSPWSSRSRWLLRGEPASSCPGGSRRGRGSLLAMGGAGGSEHGGQRRPWRRCRGALAGSGACAGRAASGGPSPGAGRSPGPGPPRGGPRERAEGERPWAAGARIAAEQEAGGREQVSPCWRCFPGCGGCRARRRGGVCPLPAGGGEPAVGRRGARPRCRAVGSRPARRRRVPDLAWRPLRGCRAACYHFPLPHRLCLLAGMARVPEMVPKRRAFLTPRARILPPPPPEELWVGQLCVKRRAPHGRQPLIAFIPLNL